MSWLLAIDKLTVVFGWANTSTALVLDLCYRFINVCKLHLGKIDEEPVKNNVVVIYARQWSFFSSKCK
jgi:hypothetical protein